MLDGFGVSARHYTATHRNIHNIKTYTTNHIDQDRARNTNKVDIWRERECTVVEY